MNSVLAKYEAKLKKAQLSKLKLSDVITIKKKLIKKLIKEVQGYRTASADYSELQKVDSGDIKRIIRNIKKSLKY
jgi:ASC-1-like (ASCH) protein